jgi:sugar phosphate permease
MIDQHGPRQVYGLALLGVAIIPLPFAFSDGLGLVLLAQAISGLSWGCHELSQFALILDSTYKRTRAQLFAAQSVLNGAAMLAGCLAAAPMLAWANGNLRALFFISMTGRLALGIALPKLLPVPPGPSVPRRRDLLLRVIGIRAHGGLVHRPLEEQEDEEREAVSTAPRVADPQAR